MPKVEQTHLFQGLTLCTAIPDAIQKSQIQGPSYLHCLDSEARSCLWVMDLCSGSLVKVPSSWHRFGLFFSHPEDEPVPCYRVHAVSHISNQGDILVSESRFLSKR